MSNAQYNRLMSTISIAWVLVVSSWLFAAIWGAQTWPTFGRVAATASLAWVLLAIGISIIGARTNRPAPRAPRPRRFE